MAQGEFDGKVVVVTGAGSGIGRASAAGFAADGARVVVNDVDAETAEATVELIRAVGGEAHAHPADVGHSAAVDELIDATVARFGKLDVLHNNAGYGLPGRVATTTDDVMAEMLRVNLCGVLYGTRAALRHMVERQSGVIVNTASNAALGAPRDRRVRQREGRRDLVDPQHRGRERPVRRTGGRDLPGPDRDARVPPLRARPRLLPGPDPDPSPRSPGRRRRARPLP